MSSFQNAKNIHLLHKRDYIMYQYVKAAHLHQKAYEYHDNAQGI